MSISANKQAAPKCSRVSISEIDPRLPADIYLCDDGMVREVCDDGRELLVQPQFNQNGKAFLEFEGYGNPPTFTLWIANGMYRAFCGPVSKQDQVIHIDGNRRNLHPHNLKLAKRDTEQFKLVRRHGNGGMARRFLDS